MGRSAHVPAVLIPDHRDMDRGLHLIADDLSETWIEDWAAVGLSELEALLAKHAAFLGYLEDTATELEPS
jgi:hypothetical protein